MTEPSGSRPRPSRSRPSSSSDLENHRFEPVRILQWRNRDLDPLLRSTALRGALAALPPTRLLTRAQASFDVEALELIARDDDIVALASTPADGGAPVGSLPGPRLPQHIGCRACQPGRPRLPLPDQQRRPHPEDWFARQLSYCDRTEGDIDTLSNRIAHIRTWTFIANRPTGLPIPSIGNCGPASIEDRLSDALHESLTQRFIDRRTSVLMRRLRRRKM